MWVYKYIYNKWTSIDFWLVKTETLWFSLIWKMESLIWVSCGPHHWTNRRTHGNVYIFVVIETFLSYAFLRIPSLKKLSVCFKLEQDDSFFNSPKYFKVTMWPGSVFSPKNVEPFASNVKSAKHLECANQDDIEYIKRHSNIYENCLARFILASANRIVELASTQQKIGKTFCHWALSNIFCLDVVQFFVQIHVCDMLINNE